jgi:uncharacterized membrane protein
MDREFLAYCIIAATVVAFTVLAFYARHNSRHYKAVRQKEQERQRRLNRRIDRS